MRTRPSHSLVHSLATCAWIAQHRNLILIGPTGIGKSWLGEAFAERACRSGYAAYCVRASHLFHELHVARGGGSYTRMLARLAKMDLLAIDDWGLAPFTAAERRDLLEIPEDPTERAATLITSQIPVTGWHDIIGEPTLADAICDRLIHTAYMIELSGPSLGESRARVRAPPRTAPMRRLPAAAVGKPSTGRKRPWRSPRCQNRDRVEAQEGAFGRGAATLLPRRAPRRGVPGRS